MTRVDVTGVDPEGLRLIWTNRKPEPVATAPVQRTTLTPEEAAASLGVSLRHYERHIQPRLRTIRSGAKRLVAPDELAKWATRSATLAHGSRVDTQSKRPRAAVTAGGMAHGRRVP